MTEFTPVSGFMGGLLIGASAVFMLWSLGRIAGISGILGGALNPVAGDSGWRLAFLAGLIVGPLIVAALTGQSAVIDLSASWPILIAAGLLVGFGTRLGAGCTSGHGVCGLARLAPRSIVATAVFMGMAAVTVYVMRHVVAGG